MGSEPFHCPLSHSIKALYTAVHSYDPEQGSLTPCTVFICSHLKCWSSSNNDLTGLVWFLCFSGLQVIFPDYLQEKFVQSALSYIMCNGEGEYVCHDNKCICQCADEYPQCNCPFTDIQIMEKTLLGMSEAWAASYKDFEASGKKKIPPWMFKKYRITADAESARTVLQQQPWQSHIYHKCIFCYRQYSSTILYTVWKKLVVALPGALFIYYWKYKSIPIKPASTR